LKRIYTAPLALGTRQIELSVDREVAVP